LQISDVLGDLCDPDPLRRRETEANGTHCKEKFLVREAGFGARRPRRDFGSISIR
jgi:hypothetical protein